MIDDLAMNAYLAGYIAALRGRHRKSAVPENPYADEAQRAGWVEGCRDAAEEFGGAPTRHTVVVESGAAVG